METSRHDRKSSGRTRSPQHTSGRVLSEPERQRERERERLGRQGAEADACRSLWLAVIRQAVRDLIWLQEHGFDWEEADSQKHQEILLYNPVTFLGSGQLDEICRRIDLDPGLVRELLDVDCILGRAAAA